MLILEFIRLKRRCGIRLPTPETRGATETPRHNIQPSTHPHGRGEHLIGRTHPTARRKKKAPGASRAIPVLSGGERSQTCVWPSDIGLTRLYAYHAMLSASGTNKFSRRANVPENSVKASETYHYFKGYSLPFWPDDGSESAQNSQLPVAGDFPPPSGSHCRPVGRPVRVPPACTRPAYQH